LKVQLLEKIVKIPVEVQDSFYFCKDEIHNVYQIVSKYKNVYLYDLPNSSVYLSEYQNLEQGLYYILHKDSLSNCSSERKKVWVNLPSLDVSIKKKEPYCGFENGELEFINNNLFENISFFVNSIPQKNSIKILNSGEYSLRFIESSKLKCKFDTIIRLQCKDSNLQEILTPNMDNYNDFFVLELQDAYPNLRLLIYNRWGNSVYESTIPYKDNWNGVDTSGNPLPTGTYYYVIEKERNQILKSGFIELVR
jgi:gliding motility-associated-like protein